MRTFATGCGLALAIGSAACSSKSYLPRAAFEPADGSDGDARGDIRDALDPLDTADSDATDSFALDAVDVVTPDTSDARDACSSYCACMFATCAGEPDFPFPSEGACQSWCSKRSEPEKACFAGFCDQAAITKAPSIKSHDCQHAAGVFGVTEC